METGINVTGGASLENIAASIEGVERIFAAAFNTHMSEAVVIAALSTFAQASSINGLTIRDCTVTGGDTITR